MSYKLLGIFVALFAVANAVKVNFLIKFIIFFRFFAYKIIYKLKLSTYYKLNLKIDNNLFKNVRQIKQINVCYQFFLD